MDKQKNEDLEFVNEWTKNLLDQLNEICLCSNDPSNIENAIGECSLTCFKKNGFDKKLNGFSNIEDYLHFCETDLGWKVNYDKEKKIILCYEQNDACLCPIVRVNHGKLAPAICCCTQGEIKRMFQYALKQKVDVEIVHSFIRDGKSCVYKVILEGNDV